MADDMGDKTEAPTARRRTEARNAGTIARSRDLSSAALVLGSLFLLKSFSGSLIILLKTLLLELLNFRGRADMDPALVYPMLSRATVGVGSALAPLFIGAMLIAIGVNVAQTGLYFNTERLTPNLNALNPANGISRLFSGGKGGVAMLMNLAKVGLVGLTAYSAVHGKLAVIVASQQMGFVQIAGFAAGVVYSIILRVSLLLLVLAIVDYVYQRHTIEQSLRMSKQEIKDEMKNMDGDPHIKARRRQLAMQRHRERLKTDVPKADVIVTNPTEFAVALQYDPDSMAAPKVVAKGQGYMAARIREIAIANGIPILERKPLARALYKLCAVGQEVPEQFYSAIAEILAYVYELTGRSRVRRAG